VPFGRLQSAPYEAEKKNKQLALEAEIADNLRHLLDRVQLEKAAASGWHSI
jgi:hypothetical protein